MNLVEVDFNQKRNKIPELLFGHFIEHWGRCINFDGICAEMLINNKFEDIPGSNYYCTGVAFPWELTKFSWGVGYSIDKLIYKTGNSSQLIDKKNGNQYYYGICQKVWVEKNKTYNIRITLKTNKVGIKVRLAFTDSKEKEVYGQNELKVDSPLWETHNIQITSSAYDRNARFSISIKDTARLWIDFVSLMEAEHINTCRRDLVEKIRDIKPSIIRWPGGWFADHYHWRDGIGPVEERPTRVRRELSPIEPNNFGTDEYIQFCRNVGAEPYINLNFGTGSLKEMLDWVDYCNGDINTEYGRIRAANHPEPYRVKYWCIGNEMYLKNYKVFYVEPEVYGNEVVKISKLLKEKYPYIKIIATGHGSTESDWNKRLLRVCGEYIDILTIHKFVGGNWYQEGLNSSDDYLIVDKGISATEEVIKSTINDIKQLGLDNVKIGMDEWNVWLATNNFLEHDYTIREGIYTARMLHLFFRYSDMLIMSAPAQLVNVMGIINTDMDQINLTPSYNVFKLYRNLAQGYTVSVEKKGNDDIKYLDCMAIETQDGVKSV